MALAAFSRGLFCCHSAAAETAQLVEIVEPPLDNAEGPRSDESERALVTKHPPSPKSLTSPRCEMGKEPTMSTLLAEDGDASHASCPSTCEPEDQDSDCCTAELQELSASLSLGCSRGMPREMPTVPPLLCEAFPSCGVDSVLDALSCVEDNPFLLLLEKEKGCTNIRTSGWKSCPRNSGHQVCNIVYTVRVPDDIPSSVRNILGIPDFMQVTTEQRLCVFEDEITLVEETYCHDILYGDRFKSQNLTHFASDKDGGVLMRQWMEPIWTRSLPWTHRAVKVFLDRTSKSEAVATGAAFARIIGRAVGRHQ